MARLFLVLLVRKLYLSCVLTPRLELEGDMKTSVLNLELATSKITFFYLCPLFAPISGLCFPRQCCHHLSPHWYKAECVADSNLPQGGLRN